MVRKILIGAGVMVAVILMAAIALVTLVDVNRFKPQIEQYVQDRYQRTLRIDGDLGLSLFPRIALSLPPSSLSEQGGTGQAASLSGAKVSVAVMPLLRGEIVADKVTIDGLQARVERSADGRLSIDDLFAPPSPPSPQVAAPAAPPSASPSSAVPGASAPTAGKLPRFEIGGIELSNARVVFADRQAGNTITVDGLDVNTGRIANEVTTPLKLKMKFASTRPQASGELSLKGGAKLDVDQNVFGATDLNAALRATVELSGDQSLEARIEAAGIGGTTRALTVAKLTADALMRQGERTIQVKLASPLKADLSGASFVLPTLAGSVVVNNPAIPEKTATVEVAGSASANTAREALEANLTAKAQDMTLAAKLTVSGFARPKVGFDVSADKLDLDRYFPAAPVAAVSGTDSRAGAPSAGAASAAGAIDLAALTDLDLEGKLSVGQLQARGAKAADLRMSIKGSDGRLAAAPVTAALYGGRLAATAMVKAGATPAGNQASATVDLTGISIGPLLRDLAEKDLLEGRGDMKLVLGAAGGTADAVKRSLDGTAALHLRDGALKGINLAEVVRSARGLLQVGRNESRASDASKKTDFTELDVSFVIKDGIASSNDLDTKSPLIRLRGEGRADLVASRLDYTVRASVVDTTTGQGGKELDDLRGITLPVRLTGPFEKLDWQIDWQTAARTSLKARAETELKERFKTDDLEGKAKEKLKDVLKDLFRR